MTRLVIDSSAWIAFFRSRETRESRLVESVLHVADITLPDLVFLEVMYGFSTPEIAARAEVLLGPTEKVSLGGIELAQAAMQNHWLLRSKSVTVRSIVDLLVGTWCLRNNAALLHFDRDYSHMEKHLGLKVWRGSNPSPELA